jgi:hypothetical protein
VVSESWRFGTDFGKRSNYRWFSEKQRYFYRVKGVVSDLIACQSDKMSDARQGFSSQSFDQWGTGLLARTLCFSYAEKSELSGKSVFRFPIQRL